MSRRIFVRQAADVPVGAGRVVEAEGKALANPAVKVPCFPVSVDGDRVFVELP